MAAQILTSLLTITKKQLASDIVTQYLISPHVMEMIYMSWDPFGHTFKETLDLQKCELSVHQTAGLRFLTKNQCLFLASMDASTPGACMEKWWT